MDYKELKSLSEAYQSVYSPQELIEEQVWEEVENWVHSLLEEGYDLSDYTWEEMYESYLSEVVSTPPPVAMDAFASGGGAAKMAKSGMTRDQVIAQGNKNNTKLSTTTFTKPTTPAAPARPGSFAPRPATTPEKKMGGDPMDQWARANPTLAAKVKPGQSGYNTIRTRLDADNDRQENYDAYDLVLSHLINEGYADTQEAALAIMGNMSEDWRQSIVEEVFDEARRADKLGYERGTAANPNIRNISHSDPSQRTMLNSKVRRRAEEMGRERRNSPKYKQGARPPLSAKEKSFLKFADRSSPTSGNPRNPNVQDTGSQTTWPSERRAQKDPKQNPKHNANRDNDK